MIINTTPFEIDTQYKTDSYELEGYGMLCKTTIFNFSRWHSFRSRNKLTIVKELKRAGIVFPIELTFKSTLGVA